MAFPLIELKVTSLNVGVPEKETPPLPRVTVPTPVVLVIVLTLNSEAIIVFYVFIQ
jgi:hypothetical protein